MICAKPIVFDVAHGLVEVVRIGGFDHIGVYPISYALKISCGSRDELNITPGIKWGVLH